MCNQQLAQKVTKSSRQRTRSATRTSKLTPPQYLVMCCYYYWSGSTVQAECCARAALRCASLPRASRKQSKHFPFCSCSCHSRTLYRRVRSSRRLYHYNPTDGTRCTCSASPIGRRGRATLGPLIMQFTTNEVKCSVLAHKAWQLLNIQLAAMKLALGNSQLLAAFLLG